ncbi:MAG: hypothetical protein PUC65_02855 [Clostridiales bacterium]|nr:hypothetical protein [Clostridiales bacterium]
MDEHNEKAWTKFSSHLEDYSLFFDALIMRSRYFKLDAKLRADTRKYRNPEFDITQSKGFLYSLIA